MNLKIENASKTYMIGKSGFEALKDINLSFQSGEFVSILGASGSGKTTLLNIIGGLDRLTSGKVLIDGKDTSSFKDKDWDAYRNNSVGFVFQNYNLISHVTVSKNVELGLALCGTNSISRKKIAEEKLHDMGILDQKSKLPTLLSGGQKQRAAIARALANNPQIILADEPTGALDSTTSGQIMKILKEISKTKLVIMVTHNSEIAKKYSTRIIKLKDGVVESDSSPLTLEQSEAKYSSKKTAMSFWQALKLSFSNLLTKKGRTALTSFASSIGIIGVGLVMALSNGLNTQINQFERNILTEVPIEISGSVFNFDMTSNPFMSTDETGNFPTDEIIVPDSSTQASFIKNNNLTAEFWTHINALDDSLYEAMEFEYGQTMNFVSSTADGYKIFNWVKQINLKQSQISDRYDFLYGNFPTSSNQMFLVISKTNSISNKLIKALGIGENESLSFETVASTEIKLLSNDLVYSKVGSVYVENFDGEAMFNASQSPITISGIARIKEDVDTEILSTGLYYLPAFSEEFLAESINSQIVVDQLASETPVLEEADPFSILNPKTATLRKLGGVTSPSKVVIYPKGYDQKDSILAYIEEYNALQAEEVNKVTVQDITKMLTSTIRSFTSIVSIALTIFASIALVVSSIMIGVVTYISVIERTKEIGILRSLGATKGDVSRVFNAETIIIGFLAGLIGVVAVALLSIPANMILDSLIPATFGSIVQPALSTSLFLVLLSIILTFIAGLIPSRLASRKDPVVALRTE